MTEVVSYPNDGHRDSALVEAESFWFRHRNDCLLPLINNFHPAGAGLFLDIGGGNGFVSSALQASGHEVALLEPGLTGCKTAKARGVDTVIHSTLRECGFPGESVPAVGLFDVIEHMEDDVAFLQEVREILPKNGCLFATVPAWSFLWSEEDEIAGHFRRYNRVEFHQLFEDSGFKVSYITYFFTFLPAPIFLLRTIPSAIASIFRRSQGQGTGRAHHASPKSTLSGAIKSIHAYEVDRITNLTPLPFGASLLAVVTKV